MASRVKVLPLKIDPALLMEVSVLYQRNTVAFGIKPYGFALIAPHYAAWPANEERARSGGPER